MTSSSSDWFWEQPITKGPSGIRTPSRITPMPTDRTFRLNHDEEELRNDQHNHNNNNIQSSHKSNGLKSESEDNGNRQVIADTAKTNPHSTTAARMLKEKAAVNATKMAMSKMKLHSTTSAIKVMNSSKKQKDEWHIEKAVEHFEQNETETQLEIHGIKKIWENFIQTTSIAGWNRTHRVGLRGPTNAWKRSFWAILCTALFVASFVSAGYTLAAYFRYDVRTFTSSATLELPAVSICNLNPAKFNSSGFQVKRSTLTMDSILQYGYTINDLVVSATSPAQQVINSSSWAAFIDPQYGRCFTNADFGVAAVPGEYGAIELQLKVNPFEALQGVEFNGAIVLLHDRKVAPVMSKGTIVRPGTATLLAMQRKQYRRLPKPYTDCACRSSYGGETGCTDTRSLSYSMESCMQECTAQNIVSICGCSLGVKDGVTKNCFHDSDQCYSTRGCPDYDCALKTTSRVANGELSCDCKLSCSEDIIQVGVHYAEWPSPFDNTLLSLANSLCWNQIAQWLATGPAWGCSMHPDPNVHMLVNTGTTAKCTYATETALASVAQNHMYWALSTPAGSVFSITSLQKTMNLMESMNEYGTEYLSDWVDRTCGVPPTSSDSNQRWSLVPSAYWIQLAQGQLQSQGIKIKAYYTDFSVEHFQWQSAFDSIELIGHLGGVLAFFCCISLAGVFEIFELLVSWLHDRRMIWKESKLPPRFKVVVDNSFKRSDILHDSSMPIPSFGVVQQSKNHSTDITLQPIHGDDV